MLLPVVNHCLAVCECRGREALALFKAIVRVLSSFCLGNSLEY